MMHPASNIRVVSMNTLCLCVSSCYSLKNSLETRYRPVGREDCEQSYVYDID